jgi:hypothetical protein
MLRAKSQSSVARIHALIDLQGPSQTPLKGHLASQRSIMPEVQPVPGRAVPASRACGGCQDRPGHRESPQPKPAVVLPGVIGPSQYSSHLAGLRRQGISRRKRFHARCANYQSLGAGDDIEPPAVAGVEKPAREAVRISGARRFTPAGLLSPRRLERIVQQPTLGLEVRPQ